MTAAEPWRSLPPDVADVIEPELGAVTDEILADDRTRGAASTRGRSRARFGRGVRTGVTEALRQFVALIRDPDSGREPGREVYVGLGRGELRQGRTLDALQSAYRVGARVAWRRLAEAARGAGLDSERPEHCWPSRSSPTSRSCRPTRSRATPRRARSVEGERQRRRRELVALLLRDPPPAQAELRAAAEAAGWKTPRTRGGARLRRGGAGPARAPAAARRARRGDRAAWAAS